MKKRYGVIFVALAVFAACFVLRQFKKIENAPHLAVYGPVHMRDGIGRQSLELIQALKDDVSIQLISTRKVDRTDVSSDMTSFLKKHKSLSGKKSKVAILEDILWVPGSSYYKKFIDTTTKEQIRIAYSMCESTAIPSEWVLIFNQYFDAVVVPDPFFVQVYKNCGVKIPVFELPLGIYLQDYLTVPLKQTRPNPFVFGSLSACDERKNHMTLLRAFARAFGDRKDVQLKMNCRQGDPNLIRLIKEEIDHLGLHNVQFTNLPLRYADYIKLFKSVDCLVSLSKGEGFSFQPREAMALGIPAIVTDNTAQTTICNSGFVRSVVSSKEEAASYFWGSSYGKQFNCSVADAVDALLDVYEHYDAYLEKAEQARDWVTQYEYAQLKNRYINLVKPKKVLLGEQDVITEEYLMTTSESLHRKYCEVIGIGNS